MIDKIRLNKHLANFGVCSRRKADEHISNREVSVNGEIATIGTVINPHTDIVKFRKKIIEDSPKKLYFAFNKPSGLVSTTISQGKEKNIFSIINIKERVHLVGRLDMDSEGLMILTNDGELTEKLSHPRFKHEKEYEVYGEDESGALTKETIKQKFEDGIKIDHQIMKADKVFDVEMSGRRVRLKIILHTGYNRQIRRMSGKLKIRVTRITRTRIAKLQLEKLDLKLGQIKEIALRDIV